MARGRSTESSRSGFGPSAELPLEARKGRNLHVVSKMCLFKQRFCTSHGRFLSHPRSILRRCDKRLEKGTFMSKWILKIAVFLTSSGEGPIVSKIDTRDDNRQKESGTPYDSQLLHRNVQRFRGGLVFKAHRLLDFRRIDFCQL